MVVTRFAPSPTGYLHIGGARTALFSWLWARKNAGRFLLRIEDTDRQRSTDESTRRILQDMRWLGLNWDEGPEMPGSHGPYLQSERLDIYKKYVDRLIAAGHAYKCFETPEELAAQRDAAEKAGRGYKYDGAHRSLTAEQIADFERQGRPCVVRFKMGHCDITVNDVILGEVTLKAEELEDFVILKSDGFPTYHLAVVVDDHEMDVTHVLRGQEHLMNTPKHIALQRALGFATPHYAHLPVIFNMAGGKMSKRDKEKAIKAGQPVPEIEVHDFRVAGYMPEAILNFIALLGWSPGNNLEFMSVTQMIELFSIDRIGKTNAKFDRDKLKSFNAEYIKTAPRDRLMTIFKQFLEVTDRDTPLKHADDATLHRMFDLYQERAHTLIDIVDSCGFLFADAIDIDEKAFKKVLAKEGIDKVLADMRAKFAAAPNWVAAELHALIEQASIDWAVNMGKIAQPIRVAITGNTVSPPIDTTLEVLGRERTLARLDAAVEKIRTAMQP
jgi:glutamyl-tRNA synthetase